MSLRLRLKSEGVEGGLDQMIWVSVVGSKVAVRVLLFGPLEDRE